jgi:multimeric flavodoxin WrbA
LKIKIIGICGSPREGNTLSLVKESLIGAKDIGEVECELISLRGKLSPCVDCDKCPVNPPEKYCQLSDKMDEIYPKLIEADGIIIGSPVYFGTVTAQTKAFMDRCRPLGRAGMLLNYKVGGAIAVGGCRHGGQEKTLAAIIDYFILSGIFPVGLNNTLQVGATGVAWRKGKIEEDFWISEHLHRKVTPFNEAYRLGKTVAVMSKVMKTGLKEINPGHYIDGWKIEK